jgi:magnesium-transporting ATPase (P-type)
MQLLWINLIMDVLAAIALATEAPHPTELGPRGKSTKDQILPVMYRAIYTMVLYQVIVILTFMYAGPSIFGTPYSLVSEEMRMGPNSEPTQRMRHYSFLYHTFVLMNLFNMLNCRVMNCEENLPREEGDEAPKKDFNIFARMNKNWWFPIVMLAELNI